MRILALDPGLEKTGAVVYDSVAKRVMYAGIIPNDGVLIVDIPRYWPNCDLLAVEEMSGQGRFVGLDELRTVAWSGRFIQKWLDVGDRSYCWIPRHAVKRHLLGRVAGNDAAIRGALLDMFGGKAAALGCKKSPGPLYGITAHAWAALAVAITAAEQLAGEKAAA